MWRLHGDCMEITMEIAMEITLHGDCTEISKEISGD